MADDDKDPKKDQQDPEPKPDPDGLGEAGKKALEKERRARREAEKAARDFEARLKELEDRDKSDADKLREERDAAIKEAADAKLERMRLEVAAEKGLTPAQARRLVGTSQEELEADADELLETFGTATTDRGKPPAKPTESLRGGVDPTEEPVETDPAKLADSVPRG